ncbi:MAG: hypothetical protein Q8S13_10110, partial [Dehalococcoidia bacterium]|nr:hypothetical protein [Dehalococcoidia bacterium]
VPFKIYGINGSPAHVMVFANPLYLDTEIEELRVLPLGRQLQPNEITFIKSKAYLDAVRSNRQRF